MGKGRIELSIGEIIDTALDGSRLPGDNERPSLRCPGCGTSLQDIRREGRLGCTLCVGTFRSYLRKVLGEQPYSPPERAVAEEPAGSGTASERPADSAERHEPAERVHEAPFPFGFPAFAGLSPDSKGGGEADVVLRSTAIVSRNLAPLPFSGLGAESAPARRVFAEVTGATPGCELRSLGSLPQIWRRSLSERSFVSRSFAADTGSLIAASSRDPVYSLSDDGEHLRFISRVPGLSVGRALALAEARARDFGSRLPSGLAFARDQEFGWISSRIADCGSGYTVSATVHLPALVMTGLHERFFKSIMGAGAAVHGLYSPEGEASSGSIFDILVSAEAREMSPRRSGVELLGTFVAAAAQAERSARASLMSKNSEAVLDAAGRAFGIVRYGRRVELGEGLQYLSRLRLAALLGFLHGADPDEMARLLEELGPGSLALGFGLSAAPDRTSEEILRSRRLRAVIAGATIEDGGF